MPPSRSDRLSNMFQNTFTPEGASRCRAVASGLQGRSAMAMHGSFRERAEPMDAARPSQGWAARPVLPLRPQASLPPARVSLGYRKAEKQPGTDAMGGTCHVVRPILTVPACRPARSPLAGANAQTDYPTRAVTLVVPYQAGGGLDALARSSGKSWRSGSASRS